MKHTSPQRREAHDDDRLDGGEHERDEHVCEHQIPAWDRRREQLALGSAVAIDEHAQGGEDAAERDHEPDRTDADERGVVHVRVKAPGRLLERRREDQREQRRAEERHGDLTRRPRGQQCAAPGEREQRARCRRAACAW